MKKYEGGEGRGEEGLQDCRSPNDSTQAFSGCKAELVALGWVVGRVNLEAVVREDVDEEVQGPAC